MKPSEPQDWRARPSAEDRARGGLSRLVGLNLDVLNQKVRRLAEQNIREGESIRFCLVGTGGQAIVALEDRVLVLKTGFMAGAAFGGRATSFGFRDISGIQVNTGLVNGSIEIHTPGLGATKAGDYFTKDPKSDPWKLPNSIPIPKMAVPEYQPYLEELRSLIKDSAGRQPPGSVPAAEDLASQLTKLGELREAGILSDEEFAAAKRRLLG